MPQTFAELDTNVSFTYEKSASELMVKVTIQKAQNISSGQLLKVSPETIVYQIFW